MKDKKKIVEYEKLLLTAELYIGWFSAVILLGATFASAYTPMVDWIRFIVMFLGFALFFVGIGFCIRIEQKTGYYVCAKCGEKHIPSFFETLFAMHTGRTRYLKCPKCEKKSWQKKSLSN